MKVAIETTTAMSHGLRPPAADRLPSKVVRYALSGPSPDFQSGNFDQLATATILNLSPDTASSSTDDSSAWAEPFVRDNSESCSYNALQFGG